MLRLGIDRHARRDLEEQIARLSDSTPATRSRETAISLIRAEMSWISAAPQSGVPARGAPTDRVFVVALVGRGLPTLRDARDGRHIRAALGTIASGNFALDLIWDASADGLVDIDPASIPGRIFCKFCASPYAALEMKCPWCGGLMQRGQA